MVPKHLRTEEVSKCYQYQLKVPVRHFILSFKQKKRHQTSISVRIYSLLLQLC